MNKTEAQPLITALRNFVQVFGIFSVFMRFSFFIFFFRLVFFLFHVVNAILRPKWSMILLTHSAIAFSFTCVRSQRVHFESVVKMPLKIYGHFICTRCMFTFIVINFKCLFGWPICIRACARCFCSLCLSDARILIYVYVCNKCCCPLNVQVWNINIVQDHAICTFCKYIYTHRHLAILHFR